MPELNHENPIVGHSEMLKSQDFNGLSFRLKRVEWHNNGLAWVDYTVEMYLAKRRRRGKGKFWPANLISIFRFRDLDDANQLYILMMKGKKQ